MPHEGPASVSASADRCSNIWIPVSRESCGDPFIMRSTTAVTIDQMSTQIHNLEAHSYLASHLPRTRARARASARRAYQKRHLVVAS